MSLYQTAQRPAKTTRILVSPNITFAKDLEKDSYIQVIKKQITLLNEIRDDLWFYLILPKDVPSLVFDNVTQLIVYLPTHSHTMRAHFDTEAIKKVLPREYAKIINAIPGDQENFLGKSKSISKINKKVKTNG